MQNIYCEKLLLRSCHCDMYGAWRPASVLETMQEVAGAHSALLGLPRQVMDSKGLAWIVSRTAVELNRVPKVGEQLQIETYPTPARHLFFPRCYVFRDEAGQSIGTAITLWMLLDIEQRRVTGNDEIAAILPENRDLPVVMPMPQTARSLGGTPEYKEIQPVFTDFDVNRHVNNAKYLDWCTNAINMDVLQNKCITGFSINYDAEVCHGDVLRTELCQQGNAFSFCGFRDDKRCFGITGKLTDRL